MNTGLEGKTVLITGGSSGIGKATALAFAKESRAKIALTYFNNEAAAHRIADQIKQEKVSALPVYMSLEDHTSIQEAIDTTAGHFGSIDVLVNNAVLWGNGKNRGKDFEEMPLSEWEKVIGTNLFGTVTITQAVIPFMRKANWGRIVNVSSGIAYDSMKGAGPYGALKSALFGLTANLVEELSPHGILSNVVIPSLTFTERAVSSFPEEFRDKAAEAFPTNRVTVPEDVANMIVYLGSAANGHVNGEHIRVTGRGSQPMLNSLFKKYARS